MKWAFCCFIYNEKSVGMGRPKNEVVGGAGRCVETTMASTSSDAGARVSVCEITAASESEEEGEKSEEEGEDADEGELWKTLKDSTSYEVSSLGSLKNAITGLVLKQFITNTGGARVTLRIDGKSKSYDVHRLVAEVFLENPEEKPKVFHINDIRTDNRVKNLKWATNREVALLVAEKRKAAPPKEPTPPTVQEPHTDELWRACDDIAGYEVSNYGAVRRSDNGQRMTISRDRRNICTVRISSSIYMVHRLVAKAFIQTYQENCIVIHLNGNKTENAVTNLACTTQSGAVKAAKERKKAAAEGVESSVASSLPIPAVPKETTEVTAGPSQQVNTEPKINLAYIAGFIDGDGSVCIGKCNESGFQLKVEITQCNEGWLKEINAFFLNSGRMYKDSRSKKYNGEPAWSLRFCGHKALPVLRLMSERCIVKAPQAELGIEYTQLINRPGKQDEREASYLRMKELNANKAAYEKDYTRVCDAYIAGLMDAEGNVYNNEEGKHKYYVKITQLSDTELLKRIQIYIGAGMISTTEPERLRFFSKKDIRDLWERVKEHVFIKKVAFQALVDSLKD